MHAKLSIGGKIILLSVALMAVALVQAGVALYGFHNISDGVQVTTEKTVPGLLTSADLGKQAYLLRGNHMRHIIAQTLPEMDGIQAENARLVTALQANLKTSEATASTDKERQLLSGIRTGIESYLAGWEQVQILSRQDKTEEAVRLYDKLCAPKIDETIVLLGQFASEKTTAENQTSRELNGTVTRSFMLVSVLSAGAMLCGGLGSFFLIRGINVSLRSSVQILTSAAEQIASASSQVAASSNMLADGCSQQAATIEETSSASNEVNSMAQRNVENAKQATDVASDAQLRAQQADGSLAEMLSAMDRIAGSSQKISKIIKVIDEIAFQTNILALNAAVEAARAGDAGMGFAVVADEVRALAQRSAQAARDTSELIEDSVHQSREGKMKVEKVAEDIRSLTAGSARIKVLVDEISLGSVEQSRGMEQISRSIVSMEKGTQATAANAQEGSSAAQELQGQAGALKDVVSSMAALVEGESNAPAHHFTSRRMVAHAA